MAERDPVTGRFPKGNGAGKGPGHGGPAKGAGLWGPAKGAPDYKGEPRLPAGQHRVLRGAEWHEARRLRKAVKEEWAALHRKVTEKLAAAVEADELKPGELVAAFTATGNRAHGQPTANVKVAGVRPEDLTDNELAAIAAGSGGAAAAPASDTPISDALG